MSKKKITKSKKEKPFNCWSIVPAVIVILLYALYVTSAMHAESVAGETFDLMMEYGPQISEADPASKELLRKRLTQELTAIPKNSLLAQVAQRGQPIVDVLTPYAPHCLSKATSCIYYSSTVDELREKYQFHSTGDVPTLFSEGSYRASMLQIIVTGLVLVLEVFAITMLLLYFLQKK